VIQVPLELRLDRWSIVCLDLVELMSRSQMFPPTYSLEGAHNLRSMTLCANLQIRGVYTSDNLYDDFVSLPLDMRFKFPFDNSLQSSKWAEYFDWMTVPADWSEVGPGHNGNMIVRVAGKAVTIDGQDAGIYRQKGAAREEDRARMSEEINTLLHRKHGQSESTDEDLVAMQRNKRSRMAKMPDLVSSGDESDRRAGQENLSSNLVEERRDLNRK
jgi:hypothetical protein